jgi:hypothetical protein
MYIFVFLLFVSFLFDETIVLCMCDAPRPFFIYCIYMPLVYIYIYANILDAKQCFLRCSEFHTSMVYLTSRVIGAGGEEEEEGDDKYVSLHLLFYYLTYHDELKNNNIHLFVFRNTCHL